MKFHFCGNLEAPDWLLAEVEVMSKMSSVRIKLLCRQVLEQLYGRKLNSSKVDRYSTNMKYISNLTTADIEAILAALYFILFNSVKNNIELSVLSIELQQIGLPKDISNAIISHYSANLESLRNIQEVQSLHLLNHLSFIDYRVDYILSSSEIQNNKPSIKLNMKLSNGDNVPFEITSIDTFNNLYNELKLSKTLLNK